MVLLADFAKEETSYSDNDIIDGKTQSLAGSEIAAWFDLMWVFSSCCLSFGGIDGSDFSSRVGYVKADDRCL